MDWQTVSFDWNQARAFLVTAEKGSFSAAAAALGLTHPTLGRQVAALERKLGVMLFERAGRFLELTSSGLELLEHVQAMGDAAGRISLTASGQSQAIAGKVSITASEFISIYRLPAIVAELRELAPEIEIEIVASDDVRDLMRREADIAIRHVRPEQPDLIARQLRESTAHFYASTSYIEKYGRPESLADVATAIFISPGRPDLFVQRLKEFGLSLEPQNIKIFSENGPVAWEMMKQGLGISIMTKDIADLTPNIECVFPDLPAIPVYTWLTTHRELHTSRRIRLVFDVLAKALS